MVPRKSHLSNAAHLLQGEGSAQAKRWLEAHETLLFQGHAVRTADELQVATARASAQTHAEDLRREAGYFRDNQRGVPRPQLGACDIGAFEFANPSYLPFIYR